VVSKEKFVDSDPTLMADVVYVDEVVILPDEDDNG
jgi:hypothetical protein